MARYSVEGLNKEYLGSNEVNVTLPVTESRFLASLISRWYQKNRYKSSPALVAWIIRAYDQTIFFLLMRRAFNDYPDACEVFRFYILHRGKEALQIDAIDAPNNTNVKEIKIFKMWNV